MSENIDKINNLGLQIDGLVAEINQYDITFDEERDLKFRLLGGVGDEVAKWGNWRPVLDLIKQGLDEELALKDTQHCFDKLSYILEEIIRKHPADYQLRPLEVKKEVPVAKEKGDDKNGTDKQ